MIEIQSIPHDDAALEWGITTEARMTVGYVFEIPTRRLPARPTLDRSPERTFQQVVKKK